MLSTRSKVAASGFVMMAATWVPSASAAQIYSPSATPTSGIAVQDHIVTMVMVADNVITLAEYFSKVEPAAKQSGRPMNLVVDPSAVSRGYFMAFDSDKAAERYLTSTDMVSPSTGSFSMPDDLALSGIQARTAEAPMQTVSACGLIRMVNLYDNASCGGSYLGMIYNDYISHFSEFGHNDETSSIAVGTCISTLRVWEDANMGGSSTTFHGGSYYSILGGWNDRISSASTDRNAAC